jgi:hypothetical protein
MSFAAVSRRVAVLQDAGLVNREVRGREHWLSLRPEGLSFAKKCSTTRPSSGPGGPTPSTPGWPGKRPQVAGADNPRRPRMGRAVAAVSGLLPAPPELVYEAWPDPASLRDWMCPRPARCLEIEVQPWVLQDREPTDNEELDASSLDVDTQVNCNSPGTALPGRRHPRKVSLRCGSILTATRRPS